MAVRSKYRIEDRVSYKARLEDRVSYGAGFAEMEFSQWPFSGTEVLPIQCLAARCHEGIEVVRYGHCMLRRCPMVMGHGMRRQCAMGDCAALRHTFMSAQYVGVAVTSHD